MLAITWPLERNPSLALGRRAQRRLNQAMALMLRAPRDRSWPAGVSADLSVSRATNGLDFTIGHHSQSKTAVVLFAVGIASFVAAAARIVSTGSS